MEPFGAATRLIAAPGKVLKREFVRAAVSDCANPALASQAIHKKPARPKGGWNSAAIKEGESESPEMTALIENNREERERTVVIDR
jgi:hypothetical protein